jgi:hypothetical protein
MRVVEEFFVVEQELAPADTETPECGIDIPATADSELAVEKDNERVATRRWSRLASDARTDEEKACDVDGAERSCALADILRAPQVINGRLAFGGSGTQRLSAASAPEMMRLRISGAAGTASSPKSANATDAENSRARIARFIECA